MKAQKQQFREENSKLDALVIYNDEAIDEYKEREWPDIGEGRNISTSGHAGGHLGYAEGKDLQIHAGIEGQMPETRRLGI